MSELLPMSEVVPHLLYRVFSFDKDNRGVFTRGGGNDIYGAEVTYGAELPDVSFAVDDVVLPPWLYVVRARTVFSERAKAVIHAYLGAEDRIGFFRLPVEMPDGRLESVHLAYSTERVDVLSMYSTVSPHGVAQWWALELSKLNGRSFFIVPEARSNTVMRGDLLLALHELGWPGYATELRVMNGKHLVSYEEWAEHPEWTDYQPPR
ncbi:hypothetical protein [Demequina activiva]|uniref:Uncharacterized protein n=1 Tax=Demequina activiva TaxID=1582364 RepID=A0A919UG12_9MICO|nr:hypothetical protein [Demequina activiva]GIG53994.1 hypothetical protein Dac01nite_07460 [Demequina activiva]